MNELTKIEASAGQFANLTRMGKGRKKGALNRTTSLLKDAIIIAGERAGNKIGSDGLVSYLELQAEKNPGAFMGLLGKVLPMQVVGTGGNGEIVTEIVIRGISAANR